jgi:hypothetical protein
VPGAVERCALVGATAVAVYGAGSHTHALLPIWAAAGGPAVNQIVVSATNGQTDCDGIGIVAADAFDPSTVDAIVLSSQIFEHEMAAACVARWPQLPVVPLWEPLLATIGDTRPLVASQPRIPGDIRDR